MSESSSAVRETVTIKQTNKPFKLGKIKKTIVYRTYVIVSKTTISEIFCVNIEIKFIR